MVGVSYIEDEKTVAYSQVNTAVLSSLDFVAIGAGGLIAAGIPPAQAAVLANDPNFNPLLAFQALQVIPQFINFPNAAQDGKTSDDNVDYTFKLSYALNDAASIYGGISTGFKSSAWIISRDSRPDAAETAALAAAGTPVHLTQPLEEDMLALKKPKSWSLVQKSICPLVILILLFLIRRSKAFSRIHLSVQVLCLQMLEHNL